MTEERRILAVTKEEYDVMLRWLVRCLDAASHFGGGQKLLPLCERFVEGDLRWEQLEVARKKRNIKNKKPMRTASPWCPFCHGSGRMIVMGGPDRPCVCCSPIFGK